MGWGATLYIFCTLYTLSTLYTFYMFYTLYTLYTRYTLYTLYILYTLYTSVTQGKRESSPSQKWKRESSPGPKGKREKVGRHFCDPTPLGNQTAGTQARTLTRMARDETISWLDSPPNLRFF